MDKNTKVYDNVTYYGFWPDFDQKEFLLHCIFKKNGKELKILGPFTNQDPSDMCDFFVTGENTYPRFLSAKKQIGFWTEYQEFSNVYRFPYWKWHLDYLEYRNNIEYKRFGNLISIEGLMRPISATFTREQLRNRKNRAILFSKHLKEPRGTFFNLTNKIIGCDGIGDAFNNGNKNLGKLDILKTYKFNLCPENSLGDGYITEKIPEAFQSGCVPITWCKPSDLDLDFNKEAVINLFGLDLYDCTEVLKDLLNEGPLFRKVISTPLLKQKPCLSGLEKFILG